MSGEKIEALFDGAIKLLSLEVDDLYAVLGAQLLGRAELTRAAGIVTYLSAVRRAEQAVNFIHILRQERTGARESLAVIHEELKREGIRYLTEKSGDLRAALCNDEILRLSDQINRSSLHIIIMAVGVGLQLPWEFRSIWATVAVLLVKLGIRQFCV